MRYGFQALNLDFPYFLGDIFYVLKGGNTIGNINFLIMPVIRPPSFVRLMDNQNTITCIDDVELQRKT